MEALIVDIEKFEYNNNLQLTLENGVVVYYNIEEQAQRDFILGMAERYSSYYDFEEQVIAIKH